MSVGLDIGSKTIKIVELARSGQSFTLKGSGVVGYAGTPIEKMEDEKEIATLGQNIAKLAKEANISSKEVVVALPETQVYTRAIKFPLLTDQEIASAVRWEAEQYIPIPVKEAIIQHQVLERKENVSPPEVSVLLVAAPRKLIDKYLKVVQAARLETIAVETEIMALVRALAPPQQVVLLVDFGARSTDIAIAKNGKLTFTRSIPTAGEALTRSVAQSFGIEHQQAEQYKRAYGLSPNQLEGKIKTALTPVFNMVTDEIKKAIHYYQSEEKGEAPAAAIVSGGTAGMPEAISTLSSSLGIEVVIANPFSRVQVSQQVMQSLSGYAPLYSIAVGLAMREE
jgi:type IV pilus assembly protein PilM